jgi:hypothetical protein
VVGTWKREDLSERKFRRFSDKILNGPAVLKYLRLIADKDAFGRFKVIEEPALSNVGDVVFRMEESIEWVLSSLL